MKTYKFRLKSKNLSVLDKMAGSVNFVWNYCNDTAIQYLQKRHKWVSGYDLNNLTAGCAADLGLQSHTIQCVCEEYATRRKQYKKVRLSWRSKKRSLGWVPFKADGIKVIGDVATYRKTQLRFWKSQGIEGYIKSGAFTQDAKGNWYITLACTQEPRKPVKSGGAVGIDLGLKTLATLSNGLYVDREGITAKYADKLATAQRARKKRQVTNIHAKIRNTRKDWNHKATTKLINQYDQIFVGDVSPSRLKRTTMAKSVSDASWADFKSMLAYKAIALGVDYHEVNEKFSTVTCSTCLQRTGPSGLSALGVREWKCSCGAVHDRDVNAAQNILRFGHESLIKGVPLGRCQSKQQ